MPRKVYETRLDARPEDVWAFHSSAGALHVLTPPGRKVRLLGDDTAVEDGALHVIEARQFGVPMVWKARISEVAPPRSFRDTAERSPFKSWTHLHEFLPDGEGTLLRDTIDYEAPGGPLRGLIDRLMVSKQLDDLFEFRHRATREHVLGQSSNKT